MNLEEKTTTMNMLIYRCKHFHSFGVRKKACKNETHHFIMGHFNTVEQHAETVHVLFWIRLYVFPLFGLQKNPGFILSFI